MKSKTLDKLQRGLEKLRGLIPRIKDVLQPGKGRQPAVQRRVNDFLTLAEQNGYRLRITSGYRTKKEQAELYARGRTKPGRVVTYAKAGASMHNYGLAVDIVDQNEGYDIDWDGLYQVARVVGMESYGARYDFDKPHFQYLGGYTEDEIREGNVNWAVFD